ncbi:hypothetical protein ACWEWG_26140 [Streptomyces sp. NPDC003758]
MTRREYLERGRPVTVIIPYCNRRAPDITAAGCLPVARPTTHRRAT